MIDWGNILEGIYICLAVAGDFARETKKTIVKLIAYVTLLKVKEFSKSA